MLFKKALVMESGCHLIYRTLLLGQVHRQLGRPGVELSLPPENGVFGFRRWGCGEGDLGLKSEADIYSGLLRSLCFTTFST